MQQQEGEGELIVEVEGIIKENDLQLVETEFFRQKKTVTRVKDSRGNHFILKTGEIDPFQVQLFEIVKQIESQLCFKVPSVVKQGKSWFLMEEISGQFLDKFYDKKPNWCLDVSRKISNSYQLVIAEILKSQSLGDLLIDGQEWLFSRLNLWSKPIIDAGLINPSLVQKIRTEFEGIVVKKGEDSFGWAHGNVIGDHIIVSDDGLYLLDLNVVSRVGRGYYDFLRALDFMFLKTKNEEQVFGLAMKLIKQKLSEFDESELKLVFAFRSIGILGWDILHHNMEHTVGDIEAKKKVMLKFVKREY